jgi:hypothetical protein
METCNHMGSPQKNENRINSRWVFPEDIDFETASTYIFNMGTINYGGVNVFDLSKTYNAHSSFIGFLIDIKQRIDSKGGENRWQKLFSSCIYIKTHP